MSLTSDDLADIKQLMQSLLSAQSHQLKTELKAELLEEMDARFAAQDEKLDEILNAVGADLNKHSAILDDHSHRIAALEKKTA